MSRHFSRLPHIRPRAFLHVEALLVSLCSFAYELVYSELLTIMYGGAVVQYGLTIGLFFCSLGVGSFLIREFADQQYSNFFRAELYLAIVAPLGFVFVFWLNGITVPPAVPPVIEQIAARLPVVVIGILSGFELPLLLSMVEDESGDSESQPAFPRRLVEAVSKPSNRVLSVLFRTDSSSETTEYETYSTVLAMDYLGGLAGAFVFVFVLYPRLGLIPTVFVLALLNGVAAVGFTLRFSTRWWGLYQAESRQVVTRERKALFLACLLITGGYAGVAANHGTVDEQLSEYYLSNLIEQEYAPGTVEATITEHDTTQYQQLVKYNRQWVAESPNRAFPSQNETCFRLDTAIQLCESWAESYHRGLVDVPMTMYDNSPETSVLLVGGGDWIAADRLREHNVSVDHVDIDGEFMEKARTDPYFQQYHNNSYNYDRLDTHEMDIYRYLEESDSEYDLILLDLPGATNDDLMPLYSTEFYSLLNAHLADDGVVATWGYSKYAYQEHYQTYMKTVSDAGFDSHQSYVSYYDATGDGLNNRGERFFIFAPTEQRSTITPSPDASQYVLENRDKYANTTWRPTPQYDNRRANSVFHPNRHIIVDTTRLDAD